jgi:hypothetical protein
MPDAHEVPLPPSIIRTVEEVTGTEWPAVL